MFVAAPLSEMDAALMDHWTGAHGSFHLSFLALSSLREVLDSSNNILLHLLWIQFLINWGEQGERSVIRSQNVNLLSSQHCLSMPSETLLMSEQDNHVIQGQSTAKVLVKCLVLKSHCSLDVCSWSSGCGALAWMASSASVLDHGNWLTHIGTCVVACVAD